MASSDHTWHRKVLQESSESLLKLTTLVVCELSWGPVIGYPMPVPFGGHILRLPSLQHHRLMIAGANIDHREENVLLSPVILAVLQVHLVLLIEPIGSNTWS